MENKLRQLLLLISAGTVLFILSGQSPKNDPAKHQLLPTDLSKRLDSLRNANDLAGWLYTYREYVYEDPVKRISLLEIAQSNAWRACTGDAERTEWINGLAAQGYYLLYNGDILRSIDAYERAYRFYFDKPLSDFDILEYVLKPLGNNYTRLGDYERAFFIQEKSLVLAEQHDSSQIAPICHNLATTAIWKEDLIQAKQYCERGLGRAKKNSSFEGLLLSTLAEIYLKSGKIANAELNINSAIKILTPLLLAKDQVNAAYWLRAAWQGKGDIEKEKGHPAAALLSYKKAMGIIDHYYKGERRREKAQLLVSAAHVQLQLNEPKNAIIKFNSALSLLVSAFEPVNVDELPSANDLYGENTLSDALNGKAACFIELNKKEEALQCYMLLFLAERKLRHEFFSTAAKQQQQKENRRWTESAISTAYDLLNSSGRAEYAQMVLLFAEMSKAQLLLDEMMNNLRYNSIKTGDTLLVRQEQLMRAITYYEKEAALNTTAGKPDSAALAAKKELQFELSLLEKKVRVKFPGRGSTVTDEVLPSASFLLQSIPRNTTAVEFFTGTKNIYIIEAGRRGIEHIIKLDSAKQVQAKVNNFVASYFQQGPGNMMNRPGDYYRDAYTLYHRLCLDSVMHGQPNCMIIPDGVLGYLPFDALVTDSNYMLNPGLWPYLMKQTNLYYSYSLQAAPQQQELKSGPSVFAGFFISFDSSSQSSIPAVKKEYEEILAVTNGKFYTEQEATLASFIKSLSKVNILHVSTHSFLEGKENIPVLQFADGKFFLFELYRKAFQPQLVVLSACRTGDGMLAEGEGIISLARGFIASGAAGIVAGLWNMNDDATSLVMGLFYRQLLIDHQPANALHAAKLQWLQSRQQEFHKLPYFWAGLVYTGTNAQIIISQRVAQNKSWKIIILLLLLLLVTGFMFFVKKRSLRK